MNAKSPSKEDHTSNCNVQHPTSINSLVGEEKIDIKLKCQSKVPEKQYKTTPKAVSKGIVIQPSTNAVDAKHLKNTLSKSQSIKMRKGPILQNLLKKKSLAEGKKTSGLASFLSSL